MTVEDIFPSNSKLLPIMRDLLDPDAEVRYRGYESFRLFQKKRGDGKLLWDIEELEAKAVLQVAGEYEFPPPGREFLDGAENVLFHLAANPYPGLVPLVGAAYQVQSFGTRRATLLCLLGAIGTREAAAECARLLREVGWPTQTFKRVFTDIGKLLAYPDELLNDLIVTAGKEHQDHLVQTVLAAFEHDYLNPEVAASGMADLTRIMLEVMRSDLTKVIAYRPKEGVAWRFASTYHDVRWRLGLYCDLAGDIEDPELLDVLRAVSEIDDPKPAMFACVSLLCHEVDPSSKAIEHIAASHEMRNDFFLLLEALDRSELYPAEWRTWQMFAASSMVKWLTFPSELGCEPEVIEFMAKQEIGDEPNRFVYLWRFSVEEAAMAGISGPFTEDGPPRPQHGTYTFSRFEKWESASPIEHIERCIRNVEEWRKSWAAGAQ